MTENKMNKNNPDDFQKSGFFDHFRQLQSPTAIINTSSPHTSESLHPNTQEVSENNDLTTDPEKGSLESEAKRALVYLIRQGVVLVDQKSNIFQLICRYQQDLRVILANMYLRLILDERQGIAYLSQMDTATQQEDKNQEEIVPLITKRPLTLYDTLLLLVLRKHYQEREKVGEEKIIIDNDRIDGYLMPFLPLTNKSKTDRTNLKSSLKRMSEKYLISQVRNTEDRWEISPLIRYVVNADFLDSLLAEYQKIVSQTQPITGGE